LDNVQIYFPIEHSFEKQILKGHYLEERLKHRCPQVENPEEGVPEVFAKIPRGVKALRKNCQLGPPISGFVAFLLTNVLKFAWEEGPLYLPSPLPPSPPCMHLWS
jgi:hypothetical protein